MIIVGDKIKNRKQLADDYAEKYGDVSDNMFERLQDYLGDKFNKELISRCIDRVNTIRERMTYSEITMTFYEVPKQAHRPRARFDTKSFRTPNASDNAKAIEKLISKIRKDIELISTPMKVILTAYFPMPKGIKPEEVVLYETQHQYAIGKPDFDNVLKSYCDMIQNTIILDDDLVCSSQFDKYYSLKPRVYLRIIYQDYFEAESSYKRIIKRKTFIAQRDRIHAELLLPIEKKQRKKVKN